MLVPLPIQEGPRKVLNNVGPLSHNADLMNVFVDSNNEITKWPGYEEFSDTGEIAAIDGMFWWDNQTRALVVCNGKTFQITDRDGTIAEITGDSFEVGTRVKFIDFTNAAIGDGVYAANGFAGINQILTSAVALIDETDDLVSVTHVGILDRYLIGNKGGTGEFHWSNVNDPLTWGGNYAEAESKSDDLVALDTRNFNIFLMGKQTLEKWHNESGTFTRLYQGVTSIGISAPYSFVWCDSINGFCWLDNNRRFILFSNGTPSVPSLTINKYIRSFGIVSDAIGDFIEFEGRPYYILTFPSEEEVLVWDFISARWYRLGSWDDTTGTYKRYRANCYCFCPQWNITLIGDKSNGKIYKLSSGLYNEDSNILKSRIRTLPIDHGSSRAQKFCSAIYMKAKTTLPDGEHGTPDIMARYRDDGSTAWSDPFALSVDNSSDTEFTAFATMLGSYQVRQWEFYTTDDYPLNITSVTEDLDLTV